MSIDVCIINYNTESKLKRLISYLEPNDAIYNLYIADNGSVDGSVEYLKSCSLGDTEFNENIGYAAACNQLAAKGSGDIIGLLNADVWLTVNDLMTIQQSFDNNPGIGILGPKQRNEDGYITHAGIQGDETSARPRGWKLYDPDDLHYRHLEDMVSVSGSAYFIRRSVWEDLTACPIYQDLYPGVNGAFLPTPHYFEETFCSYHARDHGYRVFYDGRVSIGHSWHASHPLGSEHDLKFHESKEIFRRACRAHKILHD